MLAELLFLVTTALAKSHPKDPSAPDNWASPVSPDWAAFGFISLGFVVLGLILCVVLPLAFAKDYPEYTKKESLKLILTLVTTGIFCAWTFWACIWLHQANPLIYPERQHYEPEL